MSLSLPSWISEGYLQISLDAAGIVALANLPTVLLRTALTGSSSLFDALVLCPGLHRQQKAPELNGGEYPICAAMTTGYVFRVENQATVLYLQKVGRAGQLTCLSASDSHENGRQARLNVATFVPAMAYSTAVILSITTLTLLVLLRDWWGVGDVGMLILSRLINIIVIQRRTIKGWKGQPEPNEKSDLIVLLSRDRWVRIRGAVDDVKAITSGEWMRDPTFTENGFVACATLLVYLDAALAANASQAGKVLLLVLLFCSAGLLGLVNEYTDVFTMHGRIVEVDGPRKVYRRRLELAKQLVEETGRSDWAIRLGMVQPDDLESLEKAGGTDESDPTKGRGQSKDEETPSTKEAEQVIL